MIDLRFLSTDNLVALRQKVRKAKMYSFSDEIREELDSKRTIENQTIR